MGLPNIDGSGGHHARVHHRGPTVPASIVPLRGQTVTNDSTSSARGTGHATHGSAEAGAPKLRDPANLSEADLRELIGLSLAVDRRTRRRSQKDLEHQMQAAMMWQVVNTPGSTPTQNAIPKGGGKDSSPAPAAPPSGTTPNASDAKITTTVTQVRQETGTMMRLAATLLDAVEEPLKKRFHHKLPSGLMDQLQAFIQSALSSGILLVLMPAIGLLGDPKLGLREDDKSVQAATAVSYQNFVLKWVNSGSMNTFVNNYISSDQAQNDANQLFPNDPVAAQNYLRELKGMLNTALPSAVINSAFEMTGKALGLPGYANQMRMQAELVRKENTTLEDPGKRAQIAQNVALRNAGIDNFDEKRLSSKISKAIEQATIKDGKPVQFLTHDDLVEALEQSFAKLFFNNPQLAKTLAHDVADQTVDIAIGNDRVILPSYTELSIDYEKFQKSLVTNMQKELQKNNQTIAASVATNIADRVLSDENMSKYHNAQDIRNEISRELMLVSNISREQAETIAAAVWVGDPQRSNPLYDPSNKTGIMTPSDFSLALKITYQDNFQVSPNSPFGNYINFVSGIDGVAGDISPVASLNHIFYHGDVTTRSYLNPTAEDSAKFQQLSLGDPAAAVKEWGIQSNNQHRSVRVDIPM